MTAETEKAATETVAGLEPECPDTLQGWQRSAAISLKRIADAHERGGPKPDQQGDDYF